MASFWENFAEAMGWGKANHVQHLSDVSEEKKQEYRNRYADSAVKKGEEESKLEITDAKNVPGEFNSLAKGDFNSDWDSNSNYETRVYRFSYAVPHGQNLDDAEGPNSWKGNHRENGMVLVRVPKNQKQTNFLWFPNEYFNDDGKGGMKGKMGVYEAFLDDGTVLNAKDFKDLVNANPYSTPNGPGFKWEGVNASGSDALDYYKFLRDQQKRTADQTYYGDNSVRSDTARWDTNWRRWVKR